MSSNSKAVAPEVSTTVSSAGRAPRFRVLTFKEVEQLPEPEWLVEHIIPATSLTVLYGAPGVGKTFVALDMALSIASAGKWAGHETTPGAVVYVVAEGVAGLSKRLKAWCVAREVGEVSRIYMVSDAPQLPKSEDVKQLIKDLKAQIPEPVSLVIIDTLARCFVDGEENSAKDVGNLIAGADRLRKELDCAVLLVHHTTKKGDTERGSSALRGAPETMISIEAESGVVTVSCEKQKDAAAFESIRFRLCPIADSCVVEPAVAVGRQLECLRVLAIDPKGMTATEWQSASGVPETSFYRYRKDLEANGLVSKKDDRYRVTNKGFETLTPATTLRHAG